MSKVFDEPATLENIYSRIDEQIVQEVLQKVDSYVTTRRGVTGRGVEFLDVLAIAIQKRAAQMRVETATEKCPMAKSDMTPCVLKDGDSCWAIGSDEKPVCVGCGRTPAVLNVKAPDPVEWLVEVAEYKRNPNNGNNRKRRN